MAAASAYSVLMKRENAHDLPIYCCAWIKSNTAGDSKNNLKDIIVTGGMDSLIKIWSLANNQLELLQTLKGHTMAVVSVAISPDGFTLASSSLESSLVIWDMTGYQKVHEIKTRSVDVWKVVFSPDGTQVATGGLGGTVLVYGIEKGVTENVLETRGKYALSIAWSTDGKYIATGTVDGVVIIVDVKHEKVLHSIDAHAHPVRSVAFSPNAKLIASTSIDGKLKIFDVASASLQHTLDHKCWAVAATFSSDGLRLATGAADGSVRIILVEDYSVQHIFREHTEIAWAMQFNPTNDKLVSVSKDMSINIYDCPIPAKTVAKKEYTLTKYFDFFLHLSICGSKDQTVRVNK